MRRASPNPLTGRSMTIAPRKALKFAEEPNLQQMSKEFDGFSAENKLFHSTFSRRKGINQGRKRRGACCGTEAVSPPGRALYFAW